MPREADKSSTSTQEHFSHMFSQAVSLFDPIKILAFSMVNTKSGGKKSLPLTYEWYGEVQFVACFKNSSFHLSL